MEMTISLLALQRTVGIREVKWLHNCNLKKNNNKKQVIYLQGFRTTTKGSCLPSQIPDLSIQKLFSILSSTSVFSKGISFSSEYPHPDGFTGEKFSTNSSFSLFGKY